MPADPTTPATAPDRATGAPLGSAPSDADALAAACRRLAAGLPSVRRSPVLWAGSPAGGAVAFVLRPGERADQALRTDVAAALLSRCTRPAPWVWLCRDGGIGTEDADARWYAAVRAAASEAGLSLRFAVVTPGGWVERGR